MGRKRKPLAPGIVEPDRELVGSGRISLRVPPALHAELSQMADALGIDLSGLLNMMINESRPRYLIRASMARAKLAIAQASQGGRYNSALTDVLAGLEQAEQDLLRLSQQELEQLVQSSTEAMPR
jgi:hypothetical protein